MALRFTKMHGLGNDFAIVDCRTAPLPFDAPAIRRFGDRHVGVGFDQLLTIEPSADPDCRVAYGIWNTDGTRAGQCGNGLRCVARWLARDGVIGEGAVRLSSPSGPVDVTLLANGEVRATMGEPRFSPADIPLLAAGRADAYAIDAGTQPIAVGAVSMGNPHAVIEVADVDAAPVALLGPRIGHAPQFPQHCNVGFVQRLSRIAIRLRVWERGVGETLACGSGACAAVAVLRARGQLDAAVDVQLPGGTLRIEWQGEGHPLWMQGPAAFVYDGEWLG